MNQIYVFANKVAGNRELNYKHWQLFLLKHSRFKPFISFSNAKKMSCLFKFKSHKSLITCIGMYLAIISYLTKVNYLLILCCVNFYFIPCMHLKNSQVYWNSLSTLYTLSFSSKVFVCQASLFVLHKDTWRGIICKLGTLV